MPPSVEQTEQLVVSVLVQLAVIILCARVAGAAAAAVRQPRAVGEIIAGLLLGPSFFGTLFPELSATLFAEETGQSILILSQVGLTLLMFQIGADFEFGHLGDPRNRRAVFLVSMTSIAAPLAAGYVLGRITAPLLAPGIDPAAYSYFLAVALAITAVPILGRILREYRLTSDRIGVIAISAAAINDVVGWVLLAAIAALASSALTPAATAFQIGGIGLLVAALWFAGAPFVDWLLRRFSIESGGVSGPLMAIVLAMIFLTGVATEALGIFTIFGGFLVGLLFHRHTAFVAAWRNQVGQFTLVFFLPIFFTYTGLRTNVLGLDGAEEWFWCATILAAASLSKFAPVFAAARIAGLSAVDSTIIGALMNTRALMELIVLNIGLSLGVIPQDVFTMLVIMAIGTTLMTGPLLQWLLPKAGHSASRDIES